MEDIRREDQERLSRSGEDGEDDYRSDFDEDDEPMRRDEKGDDDGDSDTEGEGYI